MATHKKPIIKSSVLDKQIASALAALNTARDAGIKAVGVLSVQAKKLATESKRFAKKRTILLKRKQATTKKLKTAPDASVRKLLLDTGKELAVIAKQSAKTLAEKSAVTTELASVRILSKNVSAYAKALEKADQALSKPAKKRRAKPAIRIAA
ncbi:MAG TPA: hypothetical protein VGL10_06175 [Gammaproteobacteria bacterium]